MNSDIQTRKPLEKVNKIVPAVFDKILKQNPHLPKPEKPLFKPPAKKQKPGGTGGKK